MNAVVESAYRQVTALKRDGRKPREIHVGEEQFISLMLMSREQSALAGFGMPDGMTPSLLGYPLRRLPIRSCLEVVP
jgi:hypothetical protein